MVLSPAPGFLGAACWGAAGPGRVPGLPKQRRGRLGRVGRLHAQPCLLPAQPCRGDPGSRLCCRHGPREGVVGPLWGEGTLSAGSGARGPGFALTGGERGPDPEQCTVGEPSHACQDAAVYVPGEPGEGTPQCSGVQGLHQHGAGAAPAQCRGAPPLLSQAVERGPVGVWCCRDSSVQSQRLAALARN